MTSYDRERLASLIDHTLLAPSATASDVERLCLEAREFGFAAVCVNPMWVATAAHAVAGTSVRVCSVVAFPLGATTTDTKAFETRRAIADGAHEVDMVLQIGRLKAGQNAEVQADIEAVTSICRERGVKSKVIIEAALLTDGEKITACGLAQAAGADYVKTSTGFGPGGATVADVTLMRRAVGPTMGVKAAGGIRDLETLTALIGAGATRIGTSAGVQLLREVQSRGT